MVPVADTRRVDAGSAVISAWELERNTKLKVSPPLVHGGPDCWC
jgi:hypothetical protein